MAPKKQYPVISAGLSQIDLTNYSITFNDDFNTLSISANSGTTWIWNKPDGQNFGGIGWNDVFSVKNSILTIQAKKVASVWHAGIISSVGTDGSGFAQQHGYFEAKMRLPPDVGHNWPAFWLLAQNHISSGGTIPDVEVDVVEQFGNFFPFNISQTYHHWLSPTPVVVTFPPFLAGDTASGFHTYGVSIESDFIIFYFDRTEIARMVTPAEANTPMYMLVDLALSGDPSTWDQGTNNPSSLYVDYVRVYKKNS